MWKQKISDQLGMQIDARGIGGFVTVLLMVMGLAALSESWFGWLIIVAIFAGFFLTGGRVGVDANGAGWASSDGRVPYRKGSA